MRDLVTHQVAGAGVYSPADVKAEALAVRNLLYAKRMLSHCGTIEAEDPDLSYSRAVMKLVTLARVASDVLTVRGLCDIRPDVRPGRSPAGRLLWTVCLTIGADEHTRMIVDSINFEYNKAQIWSKGLRLELWFDVDLESMYGAFEARTQGELDPDSPWTFMPELDEAHVFVPAPLGMSAAWKQLRKEARKWEIKTSAKEKGRTGPGSE